MSNFPAYLSIHSVGAWWGAWVAPGQKYMKNGLSGAITFASLMNSIALSVRSVVRWYPSSGVAGWSTGWLS